MINSNEKSNLFFQAIFFVLLLSVFASYCRYVVWRDFQYFLVEDEIPSQFDLTTYIN